MSVEGNITRAASLAALVFGSGCSGKSPYMVDIRTLMPTNTATATPTETPTPISFSEALATKIAPYGTPGVLANQVRATSEAFINSGWRSLEQTGFPEKAMSSVMRMQVTHLDLQNKGNGAIEAQMKNYKGSGNLMYKDGYWVFLTALHVLNTTNPKFNLNSIQEIYLTGDNNLPDPLFIDLTKGEFGLASAQPYGLDFGMIVFPEDKITSPARGVYKYMAMTEDQINFEKTSLDNNIYYGLCFDGRTDQPIIGNGNKPMIYDNRPQIERNFIYLEDDLVQGGCSGGGVFIKKDGKSYYVGPTAGTVGYSDALTNITMVTNIASLGKGNFDKMINVAIQNFVTGNQNNQRLMTPPCAGNPRLSCPK